MQHFVCYNFWQTNMKTQLLEANEVIRKQYIETFIMLNCKCTDIYMFSIQNS